MVENKRNLFRVNLLEEMCGSISIYKFKENVVKSGKSNVCIVDISAGGLQFKSKLNFPVEDVLYKISFTLYDEVYELKGILKWQRQNRNNTFNYGMMFCQTEKEREDLVQIMTKFMVQVKKNAEGLYSKCNRKCPNLEELRLK